MAIGERVRDYRLARRLTQEQLASRTGIPPTSLSRIEHNERKMTFEEAMRVAEVLDVSLAMLAGGDIVPVHRDTRTQALITQCLQQGKAVQRKMETLVEDLHTLRVNR